MVDVKELVRKCAEEVLNLSLGEDLDAYDKMRAYGNALIKCVRKHFIKRVLPDEVGYGSGCIYAVKYLPAPSYDVWGNELDRDVVILRSGLGFMDPKVREELIEVYKKKEISFCIIDKETQKLLQEELNKYVALDCDEFTNTPALMCWGASYMEDYSPLEEWNEVARKLREEWERKKRA
jgi:hypothetical protein